MYACTEHRGPDARAIAGAKPDVVVDGVLDICRAFSGALPGARGRASSRTGQSACRPAGSPCHRSDTSGLNRPSLRLEGPTTIRRQAVPEPNGGPRVGEDGGTVSGSRRHPAPVQVRSGSPSGGDCTRLPRRAIAGPWPATPQSPLKVAGPVRRLSAVRSCHFATATTAPRCPAIAPAAARARRTP